MADIPLNTSQQVTVHENAGQNLTPNGTFENAPTFTAATNTNARFIDGTAAGSITNDAFKWTVSAVTGTVGASFDNSTSNSGTFSMKASTLATGAAIDVSLLRSVSAAILAQYGIAVLPSTAYILTFAHKVTVNSGAATTGSILRVAEYNDAGTVQTTHSTPNAAATIGWTNKSLSFTTTASTTYVNFILKMTGNDGTATMIADSWFDDIVFQSATRIAGVDVPLGPIITPGIQDISGPKIWN